MSLPTLMSFSLNWTKTGPSKNMHPMYHKLILTFSQGHDLHRGHIGMNWRRRNWRRRNGFLDLGGRGFFCKGTFFSESTNVFVITPNRQTFFCPETENLNFGDFKGCLSQPKAASLPLQGSNLSNFKVSSISKQFFSHQNSTFQFQGRKMFVCLMLWPKISILRNPDFTDPSPSHWYIMTLCTVEC